MSLREQVEGHIKPTGYPSKINSWFSRLDPALREEFIDIFESDYPIRAIWRVMCEHGLDCGESAVREWLRSCRWRKG